MVIWWECKCQHIIPTHIFVSLNQDILWISAFDWPAPSIHLLRSFSRKSLCFVVYVWLYTLLALLLSMTDIFSLYFNVIHRTATRWSKTYFLCWRVFGFITAPLYFSNQAYLNSTRTIISPSDNWTAAKPQQFLLLDILHVFVTDSVSETTDTESYFYWAESYCYWTEQYWERGRDYRL